MTTRNQSIETFSHNMDEIISSPYVLSAVKISNLLKGISSSKILYELFNFCLEDFDYESVKKEYFIGGVGRETGRFLMPPNSKIFLAFGFTLLYLVDMKKEDLMSILGNYFYANDLNSAYKNFAGEFLKPFKEQTLLALEKMIEGEKARPKAKVSKSTVKNVLSAKDSRLIDELLDQSKGVILQYKIDPQPKAELIALYDNFKQAIFEGDPDRLKVAFLGYKYVAFYHRRLDVSVEKIEDILTKAGIL